MPKISFTAGGKQTLVFKLTTPSGKKIGVDSIKDAKWRLGTWGADAPTTLLEKPLELIKLTEDKVIVEINNDDTNHLYGMFIHMLLVKDYKDRFFITDKGQIFIDKQLR